MVLPFSRALLLSTSVAALYAGAGADAYAVGGNAPEFVADFAGVLNSGTEYYRSGGSDTTFSSVFTHSGLVLPATMTDSDGNLKWAPHNLVLNSASPATQSITVVSGADYTVEITGSGSVALSGAGSGTVTAGNPVEITASTTSLTLTVTGSPTTMWAYRSDLGGMVNNPDTSSTYVATTGAAKFLPRRNRYIYNGTSWEKAGILIEPAAATNLKTYSNVFSDSSWANFQVVESQNAVGPDGVSNSAWTITDDGGGGSGLNRLDTSTLTVATSTAYTASIYAKADQLSWIQILAVGFTTPANGGCYFDLSSGAIGTVDTGITGRIENCGSGWCRCSISFTTDASDTTGNIRIYLADANNDNSTDRDGTSSVLMYGFQFEAGSVPTSYIPTAGTTVTRAAETLTVAGSSLPANTTAMSMHMSGRVSYIDNNSAASKTFIYWLINTNANIRHWLNTASANTGLITCNQESAGGDHLAVGPSQYTPGINVAYNFASRNTSTGHQVAMDGSAGTANSTTGTLPNLTATNMLLHQDAGGPISIFRMWGTDIGEAGIEEAST